MVESNTRTPSRVDGGKICIFGDLHLSIAFNGQHISYGTECYENMESGQHISYGTECYENMERIKEICKEEKPSAIIFLGDLIGVTERNIRDRQFLMRVMQFFEYLNVVTEGKVYSVKGNHDIGDFSDYDFLVGMGLIKNPFLMRVMQFFEYLNVVTEGKVYSVKGNHDIGDFSDYDFLVGMGLIKNPKYIDYYNDERGWEVRFHLVNYGHENEKLAITEATDAVSNVVLGHADYYIDGVTNWYSAKGGVELSKLGNFCGVELVISGHIHIPSTEILYTTLKDGNSIGIFYTGSPSRVAERFDDCWYVTFEFNETGTECNQKLMNLKPAKDVFYPKEQFDLDLVDDEEIDDCWYVTFEFNETGTECNQKLMNLKPAKDVFYPKEQFDLDLVDDEEIMSKEKSEKLTLLVKDIIESRLTTGDIVSQIKSIPGFDDETKNLATDYYQKAENGGK